MSISSMCARYNRVRFPVRIGWVGSPFPAQLVGYSLSVNLRILVDAEQRAVTLPSRCCAMADTCILLAPVKIISPIALIAL